MQNTNNISIGQAVLSKAGRDRGRLLLVIEILDDVYVKVADGDLRPIERPKKKKVKHLTLTKQVAGDIKDRIESQKKVTNDVLMEALKTLKLERAKEELSDG